MKRLFLILVCLILVGTAAAYFVKRPYQIVITQADIDQSLREKFPISKTHLLIFQVDYTNPKVTLLPEANRVKVSMDAELSIKVGKEPKKFTGSTEITSGVVYKAETHQFFLSEPEINRITFPGVPQEYMDKANNVASLALREVLPLFPVYTIKATSAKSSATRLLLKDLKFENREIRATLGL